MIHRKVSCKSLFERLFRIIRPKSAHFLLTWSHRLVVDLRWLGVAVAWTGGYIDWWLNKFAVTCSCDRINWYLRGLTVTWTSGRVTLRSLDSCRPKPQYFPCVVKNKICDHINVLKCRVTLLGKYVPTLFIVPRHFLWYFTNVTAPFNYQPYFYQGVNGKPYKDNV